MKFIRLFWFDIKNGIFRNYAMWLCPILIVVVTFTDAIIRVNRFYPYQADRVSSFGDYWFYMYGGMKEYVPSTGKGFQFPIIWMTVFATCSFLVLNYPMKDMQTIGSQILVKAKKRYLWWVEKCIWNIIGTSVYHLILVFITAGLCKIFHIPVVRQIHIEVIENLFFLDRDIVLNNQSLLPIGVLLTPVAISITLNLLQMTLALFVKPVFSFLATASILLISCYLLSAFVLGNYGMPLRYNWILPGGVSYEFGAAVSLVLMAGTIIIGVVRFQQYDIINKE